MEFSRKRIIKILFILISLVCMLFANFFALKMIVVYGVDTYFYDKLLVAYTVGGEKGLHMELDNIPVTDKMRRETVLAGDFALELKTLKDPGAFLKDKVEKSKQKLIFIRNLRSAAIILMLILFAWKLSFKIKK